jgi:hypothetical protein
VQVLDDAVTLDRLRRMIQELYGRDGRGRHCHIDQYLREEPHRHCFFAYPEDYSSSDLGYVRDGRLRRLTRRLALEVIFIYRPSEGILEVLAPGGKQYVDDLVASFCLTVLGLDHVPPESEADAFNINVLLDRHFAFPCEPADRIQNVYVRELVLDVPGPAGKQIAVRARTGPRSSRGVHDVIDEYLDRRKLLINEIDVHSARLRVLFQAEGNARPKSLTFTLTMPDACTLKDDPYDQVVKRCLQRWGIIPDPAAEEAALYGGSQGRGGLHER